MKKQKLNSTENPNFASSAVAIDGSKSENKFLQLLSTLSFNIFKSKSKIAILRLEGVIGKIGVGRSGMSLDSLNDLIEKAFFMDNVIAVCLVINSPGGSPVQSDLIFNRIKSLSNETKVPVYSFIEDMAASGGYWIASAGDEIYANRSSVIGNIGVISRGFGLTEAIKKLGIERRVYSQGNNKSVLDPFKPEKESDVELIHNIQKEIHQHFIKRIKEQRKARLNQNDEILFDGKFWSAQIALDYGLIDGIDDLHSFIRKKFGKNVKLMHIKQKQSWFKTKLGVKAFNTDDLAKSLINSIENKVRYDKFDLY